MRLLASQNGRIDRVGGDLDLILVASILGQQREAIKGTTSRPGRRTEGVVGGQLPDKRV